MVMWVFGYGSLMWHPGFDVSERITAVLSGYHRSFCMRSIHHRGTPESPGLVLALDEAPNARCEGVALAVPETSAGEVLTYLRERELVSSAYLERKLPLLLKDGRHVEAVTYVVDPEHEQYCGGLDLEEQAQIIARAVGGRGSNVEYLLNTAQHLEALRIHDKELEWLSRRVRHLVG